MTMIPGIDEPWPSGPECPRCGSQDEPTDQGCRHGCRECGDCVPPLSPNGVCQLCEEAE